MKKMRKLACVACGLMLAAVVTTGAAVPAQAAPAKYVTKISSVKVGKKTVEKGKTVKVYIGKYAPAVKAKATVKTVGKASKKVTFKSSKPSVAKIGKTSGKIVPQKVGTTTIKVTTNAKKKNGKKATYSFKVKVDNRYILPTYGTTTLVRTAENANPTTKLNIKAIKLKDSTIKVKSSNTSVVSVKKANKNNDRKYILTGKKDGKATITITAKSSNKKNAAKRTVKQVVTVETEPVTETLDVSGNTTFSGFTMSDIVVSDAETLFTKDIPALAKATGMLEEDMTIKVGNDTTIKVTYANGVMTYEKDGKPVTVGADMFKGLSIKANETVSLPSGVTPSRMVLMMATTSYTSQKAYDISCKINGTDIAATGISLSNGTVTFTTEGLTFTAKAIAANGKTSIEVTNVTEGSLVSFTSTKLAKAMKDMGFTL